MRLKVTVAAVAATAALMAAPATSSAQGIDIGATCDAVLGSGTIDLSAVQVDYCLAAQTANCATDTLDILGLVVIRHGLCLDVRTLAVGGLVAVRPGGATLRNGRALRASRRARAVRKRR